MLPWTPSKDFLLSKTSSKTSSRHLQDVFARPLPKTSSRRLQNVFARRLQDVFKTSSRCFQNVFKTFSRRNCKASTSRRLQEDVLQLCLEDVFKTSWKTKKSYAEDVFKTSWKRLQYLFIKTNVCWANTKEIESKLINMVPTQQ